MATVIPAQNFVKVSISLQVVAGSPVNFQRALLLSDEPNFVTYMKSLSGLPRYLTIEGTSDISVLSQAITGGAPSTIAYLTNYMNQTPTPPAVYIAYVDREITSNNPAEYYWDIINTLLPELDFYHVFYVGNQAQLINAAEGVQLCNYFEGLTLTYTPPNGTAIMSPPVLSKPLINHLMCGDADNLISSTTPTGDNLSGMLSTSSQVYNRTQLYYPDSPIDTNATGKPQEDYYQNPLSAAVVSQLVSGSRFNRAPGALPTAFLSNLRNVTTSGNRTYPNGDAYPGTYTSPTILQINNAAGGTGLNNLLFYVETNSANVALTYETGATPNRYQNDAPPRYTDQTIAIDWLQNEIIVGYLNLLVNAGPLPFTQPGVNKIREVIENVFEVGKRLDILNPQYGPAQGESIVVPDVEDLTPQEKQSRELGPTNPVTFTTQLSESLRYLTIVGTVQP